MTFKIGAEIKIETEIEGELSDRLRSWWCGPHWGLCLGSG